MSNEITSTSDMAERDGDGASEPPDIRTDMVATHEAEGRGIEFHVSMRDYTQHDMEALIIEAAATQIVGKFGNARLAKAIEDKCIELITAKADAALRSVTEQIIDQPLTPAFGDKKPVTMREFIGLVGREYLTERVERDGKLAQRGYGSSGMPRVEQIVWGLMDRKFRDEIQKAGFAMLEEVRKELKRAHESVIAENNAYLRDALAKMAK